MQVFLLCNPNKYIYKFISAKFWWGSERAAEELNSIGPNEL